MCNNIGNLVDWKAIVPIVNGTQTAELAEHPRSTTSITIVTCSITFMNIYDLIYLFIYSLQAKAKIILDSEV
jgi:hypothetical protein